MSELDNLNQSEASKRVTLAEWRASRRHELTLPSGLVVVVRDVDMTDLFVTGMLPDSVIDLANSSSESGKEELELEEVLALVKKNGKDFADMMDAFVQAALVEPKVGETADDEHITLAELPMGDKTAIMQFVNRGAEQMRPFRPETGEPVAAVQPGDGVRKKAE